MGDHNILKVVRTHRYNQVEIDTFRIILGRDGDQHNTLCMVGPKLTTLFACCCL